MVLVQLPLEWNTYLLFNSDIVNFVYGKPMRERQKALFSYFLFFDGSLIVCGCGIVGLGRKSYIGAAEIASFSSRDVSRTNKHDTF